MNLENNSNPMDQNIVKKEGVKTPEVSKDLANQALENPELTFSLETAKAEEQEVGGKYDKTLGEVKEMQQEKSKQEKQKEFIVAAMEAIIDDLKNQAGFKPGESLEDYQARKTQEGSSFFGKIKGALSANKEILQKISELEFKKANATGKENIELVKVAATFCSKKVDDEIARVYQEVFPNQEFGNYKKMVEKDASDRIGTNIERNKWAA